MLGRAIGTVANLSDLTLYVIDVAAGDKIPRKGGPGITRSDLLGDQQDRSGTLRRRRPVGDGTGRKTDARRTAFSVYKPQGWYGIPCRR